jgi:glutaredoxin
MSETARDTTSQQATAVAVYWRPGCPYCSRLLGVLEGADVRIQLHNIWQDDEAREFVRTHNRGNETVPTVAIGGRVMTNPDPRSFLAELRSDYAHLIGDTGSAAGHLG